MGGLSDNSEPISAHQRAVQLTPDDYKDMPSWLSNLGTSFQVLRRSERIENHPSYQAALSPYISLSLNSCTNRERTSVTACETSFHGMVFYSEKNIAQLTQYQIAASKATFILFSECFGWNLLGQYWTVFDICWNEPRDHGRVMIE